MQECDHDGEDDPRMGVKRHGDACFHPVEEVVPEGYIVDGILIPHGEVKEIIHLDADGQVCRPPRGRGESLS